MLPKGVYTCAKARCIRRHRPRVLVFSDQTRRSRLTTWLPTTTPRSEEEQAEKQVDALRVEAIALVPSHQGIALEWEGSDVCSPAPSLLPLSSIMRMARLAEVYESRPRKTPECALEQERKAAASLATGGGYMVSYPALTCLGSALYIRRPSPCDNV